MNKNPLESFVHHLFPSASLAEYERLNDQQLLQRYTDQHDDLAFGEVVRRHGAMVWTICCRILGQRQDAEDVYQITFLKLVRRASFAHLGESVEGWLHTVARNEAVNAKVKRTRERAREQRSARMHEECYSIAGDKEDLEDILDKELSCLPEKLKNPIILCYLEGLTHEEAAQRISISPRCLRRRLTEGRRLLQQRLSTKPLSGEKG